jgi:hypothetical protein
VHHPSIAFLFSDFLPLLLVDASRMHLKAGDYYISSVLKKGNKNCIALHDGEGMEMSKEGKVANRASFFMFS